MNVLFSLLIFIVKVVLFGLEFVSVFCFGLFYGNIYKDGMDVFLSSS